MFKSQQRFGFTVSFLLFQKCSKSEAPMVPDNGRRTESDDATGLLQAPAKIDIVTGLVILNVEASDVFKGPAIKSHVTTRNVLSHSVSEENMTRSSGRGGDTRLDPIGCRRSNIRPAYAGKFTAHKRTNQIIEPIDIRHAVGIGVSEDFAFGRSGAGIARITQAAVILIYIAH